VKHCPTCNRSYPDETLNFCLADGAFLLDEKDSQATIASPAPRSSDMPTLLLPEPQPAQKDAGKKTVISSEPMFTSFGPEPKGKSNPLLWVVCGLFTLVIVVIIFKTLLVNNPSSTNKNAVDVATLTNSNSVARTAPEVSNTNTQGVMIPSPNSSNANRDPKLYKNLPYDDYGDPRSKGIGGQKETNVNETPTTKPTEPEDYSRVFAPKEVTQKARILSRPEPQYTEEARRNQVSGTVVLKTVFSSSGQVTNIRAVSGLPYGLTEKAIEAARMIRFSPAMKDGRAVSQYVQIEYNFNLY
jgi:TonB family protein